jgi:hypothetical protein
MTVFGEFLLLRVWYTCGDRVEAVPLWKQFGHLTRSYNGHTMFLVGLFITLRGKPT